MAQLYKQAAITIDAFAQKRLSHLHTTTFPFTKDKHTDEYMDEWFENLVEKVSYYAWYDVPYRKYFLDYVKKHFKTFPKKLINQTIKELDEIKTQDIVVIFSSEKWIDEDCDNKENNLV